MLPPRFSLRYCAPALVMSCLLVMTEQAGAETLKTEMIRLLQQHPRITSAEKTLSSSRYALDLARAGLLPVISISGEVGPEVIDNPSQRALGKTWSRTKQIAGLSVTQNLFNGFQTRSEIRSARIGREIAAITLDGIRQSVLFEGVTTYINVLRNQQLIELATETEATIKRQFDLEDERVKRGSGVEVDVLQAKSRLQLAKEKRINLEGVMENAISRYTQVFNHAPDIASMMDPMPPTELIPSSLRKAVNIAISENPAITSAASTIESARETRDAISGERLPVIDLEGSWNFEKHNSTVIGVRRDYSVVLSASWDIFTGFTTSSSQAQATFNYAASKDDREVIIRKVVEQTRLAWQALLVSRRRLELLETAVNIASEVFASRKTLREIGQETIINVLDAENEVNNAQINFTSASYDERISVYQILLSMGRLDATNLRLYE